MPPKPRICLAATSWPGCVGQARVEHLGDTVGCAVQELDHPLGVVAVPVHPDAERLEAAQHQPGVERARPPRPSRSGGRRAPRPSSRVAHDQRAADDVGVPAEVLGRRVHDDVGAERERLLQVGRGEGVVDDEQRAGARGRRRPARRCRRCRAAGWSASRPRPPGSSGRIAARTASRSLRSAGGVLEPPAARRPWRTAGRCRRTRRRGCTHVVAGPADRAQQGVLGGQPGGEGEARARRPRARPGTSSSAVRVGLARAAVLVAAAQPADAVLLVGGGLVDRRPPRRCAGRAPGRRGWRGSRSRRAVTACGPRYPAGWKFESHQPNMMWFIGCPQLNLRLSKRYERTPRAAEPCTPRARHGAAPAASAAVPRRRCNRPSHVGAGVTS